MAGKSDFLDNAILALLFNGTSIPGLADNTATSPITVLWVALHTASPGVSDTQLTNEAAYTGYARQPLARSTVGFTVFGQQVNFASNVTFPACTAGSETEQYFSIGTLATGAGEILYYGPINPSIAVFAGITPQLTTGTQVTES